MFAKNGGGGGGLIPVRIKKEKKFGVNSFENRFYFMLYVIYITRTNCP